MRDVDGPLTRISDHTAESDQHFVVWQVGSRQSLSCTAPMGVTGRQVQGLMARRLVRVDKHRRAVLTAAGHERLRAGALNDAIARAAQKLAATPNFTDETAPDGCTRPRP